MAISSPVSRGTSHCFWLFIIAGLATSSALAADRHWTGGATPGPDGFYETVGNWSPALLPTFDDLALFNINATYQVSLNSSPTVSGIQVSSGDVIFQSPSPAAATWSTQLDWTQSNAITRLSNLNLQVGKSLTLLGTSEFHVSEGPALSIASSLTVGSASTGDALFEVQSASQPTTVTVGGMSRIGDMAGGTGTMRLAGDVNASFSSVLAVGAAGSGYLEIRDGANVTLDGTLLVAAQFGPTGNGKLIVEGAGSVLDLLGAGEVAVGVTGRSAAVEVSDGGYLSTGTAQTSFAAGSTLTVNSGEVLVEGVLQMLGHLDIQHGGLLTAATTANIDGPLTIGSGGLLRGSTMNIALSAGAIGSVQIEGSASRLESSGSIRFVNSGTLNVSQGASLAADVLALATDAASTVHVNIVGASANARRVVLGGDLSGTNPVAGGKAHVSVGFGGTLEYSESLHIFSASQLTLDGGELRGPSFGTLHDPKFHFEAGTYTVTADAAIDAAVVAALPAGTLDFGRGLGVEGTATLGAPLTVNGGHLAVGSLVGGSLLDFQNGTLVFTGPAGLSVGSGGALGSTIALPQGSGLEVANGLTVATTGQVVVAGGRVEAGVLTVHGQLDLLEATSQVTASSITNEGLISGEGRIAGGPLVNQAAGVIAVAENKQLRLGSTGHVNHGRIELAAGRLEVDGHLHNASGGDIVGRGTLSFGDRLTNEGDLVLAAGATDIFGDVTNQASGRVLISGGADVVFWDDVAHTGAVFDVSAGSTATFFGQAGFSVSGGGDVYFEQDISPGHSPGKAEFGGDVYFGGGANLLMELAGTLPGTQYDTVDVAGTAHLGGTLTVALLDGFLPPLGAEFLLLSADELEHKFQSVVLPSLGDQRAFQTIYDSNALRLRVVGTDPVDLLLGDYNEDGVVNAADYVVWRNHFGTDAILPNDELGGSIGAAHYTQWKNNYGAQSGNSLAASASQVPEPSSSLLLLGIVAACSLSRVK